MRLLNLLACFILPPTEAFFLGSSVSNLWVLLSGVNRPSNQPVVFSPLFQLGLVRNRTLAVPGNTGVTARPAATTPRSATTRPTAVMPATTARPIVIAISQFFPGGDPHHQQGFYPGNPLPLPPRPPIIQPGTVPLRPLPPIPGQGQLIFPNGQLATPGQTQIPQTGPLVFPGLVNVPG